MKSVKIATLLQHFNLEIINHQPQRKYRDITVPALKRAGLDLALTPSFAHLSGALLLWSSQESSYFNFIGAEKSKIKIAAILNTNISGLILAKGMESAWVKIIVIEANKHNIPIIHTNLSSASIMNSVGVFLAELLSPEIQIHGTLVRIHNVGVLIVGESGSGKSESALELIQQGHTLISDDAVLVTHLGNRYIGRSPEITQNFLEVRGIGIIDIQATYGFKSILNRSDIDFVVQLIEFNKGHSYDRLGNGDLKFWIGKWFLPLKKIPIKTGRSVSSLIEASTNDFILRQKGLNALDIISQRRKK